MTGIRLILRKTHTNIPQLTSLVLLLMVGVCFFITLFTIARRYEESAEEYFIDNAYADVTFYGVFTDNDIEKVAARQGVLSAQGRRVQDFREGGTIFRVISLTDAINTPFLYDGRLPKTDEECVLLRRSAKAMGLSIGDIVRLGERVATITGLYCFARICLHGAE